MLFSLVEAMAPFFFEVDKQMLKRTCLFLLITPTHTRHTLIDDQIDQLSVMFSVKHVT